MRGVRELGQLPDAYAVGLAKILNYLLDPRHPVGGPKAIFFFGQGFAADRPDELAGALVDHAMRSSWRVATTTPYGIKFTFEGPLVTPSGKTPTVRSVWRQPHTGGPASFVTAYPR